MPLADPSQYTPKSNPQPRSHHPCTIPRLSATLLLRPCLSVAIPRPHLFTTISPRTLFFQHHLSHPPAPQILNPKPPFRVLRVFRG